MLSTFNNLEKLLWIVTISIINFSGLMYSLVCACMDCSSSKMLYKGIFLLKARYVLWFIYTIIKIWFTQ